MMGQGTRDRSGFNEKLLKNVSNVSLAGCRFRPIFSVEDDT
jgi:hypothetical protein